MNRFGFFAAIVCLMVSSVSLAEQKFADLVGPVGVQDVQSDTNIPYITWGGDVATMLANGGLTTQDGSIYQKQGLNITLTKGDDFVQQVRDYVTGKTPYLRGTYRMLGQASEVLGSDARTKPVIVMQLSWSQGDHIVARKELKTLNDLQPNNGKKKRIAVQQGGPHVGLLYDVLAAASLTIEDVEIVWVTDLTGPAGAAEKMRTDKTIDACCVITPDLFGLTGGFNAVGTGAEGTVEGAHTLVSTQQMSRSIADVYAVRRDYYDANRDKVNKFVAGYLAATNKLIEMRKAFESNSKMSDDYKKILTISQQAFGEEVVPTLEVDGHGLLLDCAYVGLPGQIAFFEDKGNLNGFDRKQKAALDMATQWGYALGRFGFDPPNLDYKTIASIAGIKYDPPAVQRSAVKAEAVDLFPDSNLDDRVIVSFTIHFDPNQIEFSSDRYGAEFQRALQSASTFGNAVIAVKGHSDPTKTIVDMLRAGMARNIVKRAGQRGRYQYFLHGKPLDLNNTELLINSIKSGEFNGVTPDPSQTMAAAQNLSYQRGQAVRNALVNYAKKQGVTLDASQVQPVGVGIREPVVPAPRSLDEAKQNMRVDFQIVKVPAEAISESDFAY